MNEVDVLVVSSNRYRNGINSIDVEKKKSNKRDQNAIFVFLPLGQCIKRVIDQNPDGEPNLCYFPRENFGKKSSETAPSYLGNGKYI